MKRIIVSISLFLTLFGYSSALCQDYDAIKKRGEEFGKSIADSLERFQLESFVGNSGILVAEGDSWFDYPRYNVVKALKREYKYKIFSVANNGHTLESMAYDSDQFLGFSEKLNEIKQLELIPRAILFSGGGNDIAGSEFSVLLNHSFSISDSNTNVLNNKIVTEIIDVRLKEALISWIASVKYMNNELFDNRNIPIILHGYDNAIPDGRGFLGGWWILPGPWMQPGFTIKGYSDLFKNSEVISELINRYNQMVIDVTGNFTNVCYVETVGILESDPNQNYRRDWADELHPTRKGFNAVASKFNDVIQECGTQ